MLTLRDVAAKAGVSPSTVSLVLNGLDEGRIRPALSAHVREVADALGYFPDLLARGLRTRKTHTIGLLSDQVASVPFANSMLRGAQRVAQDEGFLLLLIDTDGDPAQEQAAARSLVQRNVDALIYASAWHRAVDLPAVPDRIPLIVLDGLPAAPDTNVDWVVPDERGGAETAVRHLIAAGHSRIGYCGVDEDIPAAHERFQGYLDALSTADLPFDPRLVVNASNSTTAAARPVAAELLSSADRPTAVFCFGDQLAFGFYQAAQRLGLHIPSDLSIVGFDNQHYVADALDPGLTTVQLPHRAMGEWAARRAIDLMDGDTGPRSRHRQECVLVQRDSVGAPSRSRPASEGMRATGR
jgi:LacI family transcriptional regulator